MRIGNTEKLLFLDVAQVKIFSFLPFLVLAFSTTAASRNFFSFLFFNNFWGGAQEAIFLSAFFLLTSKNVATEVRWQY